MYKTKRIDATSTTSTPIVRQTAATVVIPCDFELEGN
jgi:hypothetical protein